MFIALIPLIVAALSVGSQIYSSSAAKKGANTAQERADNALASFSKYGDDTIEENRRKRNVLLARQKIILELLISKITAMDKNRWKDELSGLAAKSNADDYETSIQNKLNKGFLPSKAIKKVFYECGALEDEFDINARDLRALGATIDDKKSKEVIIPEAKDEELDITTILKNNGKYLIFGLILFILLRSLMNKKKK